MSNLEGKCWSLNREDWEEDLENIFNDNELKVGDIIFEGVSKRTNAISLVNHTDILDMLDERAYDEGGEYAENWINPSKEDCKDLDAFLHQWYQKTFGTSKYYVVSDIKEYVITQEDIDDYYST